MVKMQDGWAYVSLPAKWEQLLKHLADDHEVDLNTVASELPIIAYASVSVFLLHHILVIVFRKSLYLSYHHHDSQDR
jgi:hypothetical protein